MPYMTDWLHFVGIELIDRIDFSPTVLNLDLPKTRQVAARVFDSALAMVK